MARPIKVQRVDFSASDWIGGTSTLTLPECGLYIKICALIYMMGGPVTKADVRKIVASTRNETFSSILLRLIEKGKISFENGLIDQARCERELAKARRRIAASRRSGVESDPESDREAESASQTDSNESDREPQLSNEINPVTIPLTRVKGATQQPTIVLESYPEPSESVAAREGSKSGRDLGVASLPSAEPAPAPRPEPVGAGMPGAAGPVDPEHAAYVDAAVERATAALRGDVPKGIRDPTAYQAAVKDIRFINFVKKLNAWVGTGLHGEAQWAAWEVLAAAEKAETREAMTAAARKHLNEIDEMYRASSAGMETAA